MEEKNMLIGKMQKIMNLRSKGYVFDFNFPSIAIIGSQSSGKSSVIESIVGKQLLPRGTNMVTRCPIVLNLIHESELQVDYAIFSSSEFDENPKPIEDFSEVRRIILERTNRIVHGRFCVSSNPIVLNIYSKDYPNNLQLIDLPGFVRNPVADQPVDIKDQIEKLVSNFIENDNTIILAVSDVMVDMADSAGIAEARKVDKKGLRTVGVLTKLDILQKEKVKDVMDTLNNKLLPLSKGYVGVVNFPLEENEGNINTLRAKEMEWYRNSPFNKKISNFGASYLQAVLSKELSHKIREKIPDIIANVTEELENAQLELEDIGYSESMKNKSPSTEVLDKVNLYESAVVIMLEGNDQRVSHQCIEGGALLKKLLKEEISIAREEAMKMNASLFGNEIETMLYNLDASHDNILPNSIAFRKCVGILVEKFKKPFSHLINKFSEQLNNHLRACASDTLWLVPNLKGKVIEIVGEKVLELRELCKADMNKFIDIQKVFVNTGHPEFKRYHQVINGIQIENETKSEENSNEEEQFHDAQSPSDNSQESHVALDEDDKMDRSIRWIKQRATCFFRIQKGINNDPTKLAVPISNRSRKDFFLDIVLAYMLILETSLCHTALKLVMYHLINNVVDFHRTHDIYVQLLENDESKIADYLKMDILTQEKLERCLQQKESCKEVLKVLRDAA